MATSQYDICEFCPEIRCTQFSGFQQLIYILCVCVFGVVGQQSGISYIVQAYIDDYQKMDVSNFGYVLHYQLYQVHNTFVENMHLVKKNICSPNGGLTLAQLAKSPIMNEKHALFVY
jgi:hypothetical protein